MVKKFDPEGKDYDYQTALAYGMGPTGTGSNAGHWGSVAPTSDDERIKNDLPEDSYVLLKGAKHETMHKAVEAEKERGSKVEKRGKRYYSIPVTQKKKGGVISASSRADGVAQRGKTRGKIC
jgi:hypothetical protein